MPKQTVPGTCGSNQYRIANSRPIVILSKMLSKNVFKTCSDPHCMFAEKFKNMTI